MAYSVWASFLYFHYYVGDNGAKKLFLLLFENLPVLLLGEISYSVYLMHMMVIYWVLNFAQKHLADWSLGIYYMTTLAAVCAITLPLSYLSYRCIELPAMRWSSRVAKRWQQTGGNV